MSFLRIGALCAAVAVTGACGGREPTREHTVVYEVSGQETAEVAYVDGDAQLIKGRVVALPWTLTVKSRTGAYMSVLTNGAGDGALVCVLKVDGQVVSTKTSTDVPVVKCDTTLG
ncbi:MmpS family transport accessory protein [Longispora sp. NPDC051575]|uniref:MmpS family transport accessory protein n=1 Tax=Longispora sp. NPDC051575 TaxID=3154943 RepID=UPI0034209C16